MNFESIALLVQEKKFKIDFQEGRHGRYLGFPIGTIWACFDLQIKVKSPGSAKSQTAALHRPQEEEETDKSKQAQIEQTYEKHSD